MSSAKKLSASLTRSSAAEYLTFVAASGTGGIEAAYADENVWLSQKMMAPLYDVEVPTINYHLKKVFEDSELHEPAVVRTLRITAADGKSYDTKHYNLSAIIAVGSPSLVRGDVTIFATAIARCAAPVTLLPAWWSSLVARRAHNPEGRRFKSGPRNRAAPAAPAREGRGSCHRSRASDSSVCRLGRQCGRSRRLAARAWARRRRCRLRELLHRLHCQGALSKCPAGFGLAADLDALVDRKTWSRCRPGRQRLHIRRIE